LERILNEKVEVVAPSAGDPARLEVEYPTLPETRQKPNPIFNFFLNSVWVETEGPLAVILSHCVVTIFSLLGIEIVDIMLRSTSLEERLIPYFNIKLGEWVFYMEVGATTVIIGVGIVRAIFILVRP
jgi:hypothetical protein